MCRLPIRVFPSHWGRRAFLSRRVLKLIATDIDG